MASYKLPANLLSQPTLASCTILSTEFVGPAMDKPSNTEIDSLEVKIGYCLPGLYRKLLVEIGAGQQGSVEIYHPLQIAELYKHHFDDY